MKIYKTVSLLCGLAVSSAFAFNVDQVIEDQNALDEQFEPYLEQQQRFVQQETTIMMSNPGNKPDMDHPTVREATIRLVGEMISTREQAVTQAMASVDRKECREAVKDYQDTTLAELKVAYQDYISKKDRNFLITAAKSTR